MGISKLYPLGLIAAVACGGGDGTVIAYVGGNVWPGTGVPTILDAVLLVEDGRVAEVGPPDLIRVPRGAEVRRVDGRWIIPGLIDAHAHVERWMLAPLLANGVTTVRDVGGVQDSILALRDAIDLGSVQGPRLFVAGARIDGAPREGGIAVGTRSEARRAIDDLVLVEAHHAVSGPQMALSIFEALMDEAGTFSLPVAAHLGQVPLSRAIELGVTTIEHLSGLAEASARNPGPYLRAHDDYYTGYKAAFRAWTRLDSAGLDRNAIALAETGIRLVPTLHQYEAFAHLNDRRFQGTLHLDSVPVAIRAGWDVGHLVRAARLTNDELAVMRRALIGQDLFVRRFRAAGGVVAAGSDTPRPYIAPGTGLHEELRNLVEAGLSTKDALLAATRDAAAVLGVDSLGLIQPGLPAEFVILTGDPLDDITNVGQVFQVVYRGVAYYPEDFGPPNPSP